MATGGRGASQTPAAEGWTGAAESRDTAQLAKLLHKPPRVP